MIKCNLYIYIAQVNLSYFSNHFIITYKYKLKAMSSVIWVTGLSGSGKTTLAEKIVSQLNDEYHKKTIFLDGDELRNVFNLNESNDDDYDRETRIRLAFQYSNLCKLISLQNITVVIATISMFKEIYTWNKNNLSNYYEIFLEVSPEELKKRDPKNIYSRHAKGEIKNVAGIDLNIDIPTQPFLTIKQTYDLDTDILAKSIINLINKNK